MVVQVDIDNASQSDSTPCEDDVHRWVTQAISHVQLTGQTLSGGHDGNYEVSVRIVDEAEITTLNQQYRNQNKATNVLSFPADFPPDLPIPLLGDIAVCAAVVNREADQQAKPREAHWAHMLVHGTLHLLGYDHIQDDAADLMETLECDILNALGFADPYQTASITENTLFTHGELHSNE